MPQWMTLCKCNFEWLQDVPNLTCPPVFRAVAWNPVLYPPPLNSLCRVLNPASVTPNSVSPVLSLRIGRGFSRIRILTFPGVSSWGSPCQLSLPLWTRVEMPAGTHQCPPPSPTQLLSRGIWRGYTMVYFVISNCFLLGLVYFFIMKISNTEEKRRNKIENPVSSLT